MIITKKVVDFLPQLDLKGDLTKYSDNGIAKLNSKVMSLITLLMMERGTHPEYPDMGARNFLVELLQSERKGATVAIHSIESQAKRFLDLEITLEAEENARDSEILDLSFTINNLPGRINMSVQHTFDGNMRILNPSYLA